MDDRSDRALVGASQRGDVAAFTALTRRHWGRVYAVAYAELLRHEDAEDVAQDTFLRAYTRLWQLRAGGAFHAWVCRIAWSYARAHRRRHRREVVMDVDEAMTDTLEYPPDQARYESDDDAKHIVSQGLGAMPSDLRLPLVMRYMTGDSYTAIAERLSISEAGARSRVRRARDFFATYIRRAGMEEDCRGVLRTHLTVAPLAAGFVAELAEALGGGAPPSDAAPTSASAAPFSGLVAAGVAATLTLFAGVYGAHILHMRWGDLRHEGSLRYVEPTLLLAPPAPDARSDRARGRARVVIQPGEELRGWAPVEPNKDMAVPVPGVGATAVLANDFGVYKPITAAHGEVALSLDVRARPAPYHTQLGFVLDGYVLGVPLVSKTPVNQWHYRDYIGRMAHVALRPVEDRWSHVEIVYRPWNATYDVAIDGRLGARGARLEPGRMGLPVTGVFIKSGRGGVGEPLYFRQMQVSVRDPGIGERRGPRKLVASMAEPPRRSDAVRLDGGKINGRRLAEGAATVTVRPGQEILGRIDITVRNEHGAAAQFPVIQTPTWGSHERGYRVVARHVDPGATSLAVAVHEVAPSRPGTYYLLVAATAETGPEFVASGTNWPVEYPVWNNGTDIADWPESLIQEAMVAGTVVAPWLGQSGETAPVAVAATAVRVVVVD